MLNVCSRWTLFPGQRFDEQFEELFKIDVASGNPEKFLLKWDNQKSIPKDIYWKIYPKADQVPRVYDNGLPKIHKNKIPFRPIVVSMESITYRVANYL